MSSFLEQLGVFSKQISEETNERWPWLSREVTFTSQPGTFPISENWILEIETNTHKRRLIQIFIRTGMPSQVTLIKKSWMKN